MKYINLKNIYLNQNKKNKFFKKKIPKEVRLIKFFISSIVKEPNVFSPK